MSVSRPLQDFSRAHEALTPQVWEVLLSHQCQDRQKKDAVFDYLWSLNLRCPNSETVSTMVALVVFRKGPTMQDAELYQEHRSIASDFVKMRKKMERKHGQEEVYPLTLDLDCIPDKVKCMYPLEAFLLLQTRIPVRKTHASLQSKQSNEFMHVISRLFNLQNNVRAVPAVPEITMLGSYAQRPMVVPPLSDVPSREVIEQKALPAPSQSVGVAPKTALALPPPAPPSSPKAMGDGSVGPSMLEAAEKFKNLMRHGQEKLPVASSKEQAQTPKKVAKEQAQTPEKVAAKQKKPKGVVEKVCRKPCESLQKKPSKPNVLKKGKKEDRKSKPKKTVVKKKSQRNTSKAPRRSHDPWCNVPEHLLRKYKLGCSRCRYRQWCTKSCWALRGIKV